MDRDREIVMERESECPLLFIQLTEHCVSYPGEGEGGSHTERDGDVNYGFWYPLGSS